MFKKVGKLIIIFWAICFISILLFVQGKIRIRLEIIVTIVLLLLQYVHSEYIKEI
ncbi:hypothetical protein ACQPU1_14745 [Clostridium paraputrificum]|uniref:hypothetical protein n=1 Tax=Clostridium TaxID=1485 RepID=UPI003D32ABF0